MAGTDIADSVIAELDAIVWANLDPADYRDPAIEAVANGIWGYINDNWSISANTIGTVTPPPPLVPFPFGEPVTVDLTVAAAAPLKSLLLSMVSGSIPLAAMIAFFGAIASWLSAPPWVVSISMGTLINPIVGAGVATFPSMAGMATPCFAEMSASKPSDRTAAWNIIGTHIYNGLSANVIVPLATTGLYAAPPTGSYLGATTATLTF
ncbi:hypothetical protein A2Z67_06215 [Candidatus Woesebacteria bacterium RBG_13_36_22]|uniref:Uncharacterized protein n=1 Tax=Candidatus Woesebacteria bacterium RBG_13_36_22 TaxID=1802478 RepID=A0A1F7WZL1_9BACT|nr:MAG: hypothetical protein A2Z67_06215 [Candidatus Woesebacteria bacterium RBG_13_36_22]